ncbi:GtrA family protein [Vibrio coralliilyticus]
MTERTTALRFLLVGLTSTLTYLIISMGMVKVLETNPSVANTIGYIVSTSISYGLNSIWSFKTKVGLDSLFRFVFVSLSSIAIVVTISELVTYLELNHIFSVLLILLVIPVLNYLMHKNWTFQGSN